MCTDPESTSCASINYQVRMKRHDGCICQHWHWNCSHTVDPCSSSMLISSLEFLQRCNQVTWTVDFGILCTGMKSDQILPDSILTLKYGEIEAIRTDAYLVWGLSLGQQHAHLAPHEFLNTFSMVRPLEICMQCENWVILELHFAPIVLSNSLPFTIYYLCVLEFTWAIKLYGRELTRWGGGKKTAYIEGSSSSVRFSVCTNGIASACIANLMKWTQAHKNSLSVH
jgi:hypothetical protein